MTNGITFAHKSKNDLQAKMRRDLVARDSAASKYMVRDFQKRDASEKLFYFTKRYRGSVAQSHATVIINGLCNNEFHGFHRKERERERGGGGEYGKRLRSRV